MQQYFVNAGGVTYQLEFSGFTTTDINHDADAATIQSRLEALDSIDPGDVDVTGSGLAARNTLIEVSHSATTGFYKLGFGGEVSGDIEFDATVEELQTILEGLLGDDNVYVRSGDGSVGTPYLIELLGDFVSTDQSAFTVTDGDGGALDNGGAAGVTVNKADCRRY